MQTIFFDDATKLTEQAVATVGFFDGVHKGHRYLIERLKDVAKAKRHRSMIITFDKHPRQVLRSEYQPMLLSSLDEKLQMLAKTDADYCVVLPFTYDLAQLSAHDFMKRILSEQLSVTTLMIGYDNRFGHQREDGFEQYVGYGKEMGMEVLNADSFISEGNCVSSSMVRRLIAEGDMEKAGQCLGRPYRLAGKVVHGEAKGRTMGFPTANIEPDFKEKMLPKNGVYAVRASLEDEERRLWGMMNIGSRPTFDGKKTTLEVNLLDFDGTIYGKHVCVDFVKRLRDEQLFPSKEALAAQLKTDEMHTRELACLMKD